MKKLIFSGLLLGTFWGIVNSNQYVNAAEMQRLYNPNSGEHFYTANTTEKNNLVSVGWKYEGIGWNAPSQGDPVYRLYNPNAGDHHYTMNGNEKNNLVSVGWKYEGIGWYSDQSKSVPLYRAYNPNAKAGSHHYSKIKSEIDNLNKIGWKYEGVSWYGINENSVSKEKYGLNGRWYQKNGYPTTINQGSQIFAKFSGSEIKGTFKTYGTPATVVAVRIDGLNYTRITTVDDTPIVLASGLSGGEHTIEIMMDGIKETLDGLWSNGNGVSFKGFNIDTKEIQSSNKNVLFIGDSITAGINVLGIGSNPNVNSAYQTYAQVSANILNINQFRLGFGGTGVTKSGSGGVPKALDQIDYYYNNYKQDMPAPNAIVINHGTNDQGATSETFRNEYYKLILKLRSKYGTVPIMAMIPFGQYHKQDIEAVSALFDNVYVCQTSDWGVTYTDGVHPDVNGHRKAGTRLAEQLQKIINK